MQLEPDLVSAAAVTGGIVALALVSKTIGSGSSAETVQRGRDLLAQSVEFSKLAEQDSVPLFQLRHTAMALAYLSAARSVSSDEGLQRGGVDVHHMATKLEKSLTTITKRISKTCSSSNPKKESITSISWV